MNSEVMEGFISREMKASHIVIRKFGHSRLFQLALIFIPN